MTSDAHLPFRCILSIRNHFKVIPYGAVDRAESCNHGFQSLKGLKNAATAVPEAANDEALAWAINALNEPDTLFFTVGCEKALNEDGDTYYKRGYLEFAFNDAELASDSRHYFALFQEFSKRLHVTGFMLPVMFEWEIEGAHFADATEAGWTVAVWITTAITKSREDAQQHWDKGIRTLVAELITEKWPVVNPIY
jgi:hypothetical protein